MRSQRGQGSAEYMGVLLLVAVIVGALIAAGIGPKIAEAMDASVCRIAGGACEAVGIGDGAAPVPERISGRPPRPTATATGSRTGRSASRAATRRTPTPMATGSPTARRSAPAADPTRSDSDDDGLPDADEAAGRAQPREAGRRQDGLTDAEELAVGTDPTEADGDGEMGATRDGLTDKEEIESAPTPTPTTLTATDTPTGTRSSAATTRSRTSAPRPESCLRTSCSTIRSARCRPAAHGAKGARKVIDGLLSDRRQDRPPHRRGEDDRRGGEDPARAA